MQLSTIYNGGKIVRKNTSPNGVKHLLLCFKSGHYHFILKLGYKRGNFEFIIQLYCL